MKNEWTDAIDALSQRCADFQDELQTTVDMAYALQEKNFKKTALLHEIIRQLEKYPNMIGVLSCHFELDNVPEYLKNEWVRLMDEKRSTV